MLFRSDYGQNARIVGIADGSGVGEDPDGLDHAELLRLFREALPIASFDRKKLGPKGRVVGVEQPEGAQLRNTLHNRLVTDAFVPGGGRPATINDGNWRDYLTADGKPSSPIIVEGANLFLTPNARKELFKAGCLIFKDSSANKCGVICSSYEIGASMLLNEKQFLEIKAEFVEQVLVKLRELARSEAELLMAEGRRHPHTPLTELSTELSKVINDAADAIRAARFVANPGCYSTGAISLLAPLTGAGLIPADFPVSIQGYSGYTGGGRALVDAHEKGEDHPMKGAFLSYALGLEHKHIPETMRYGGLSRTPIFTPNVGAWAQGMTVTIPLHLRELGTTPDALHAALKAHYAGQRYVRVFDMAANPEVLDPQTLNGTNDLELFVYPSANGERVLLVARLDNLGKGAGGAAVQNLNLMLGL